MRSALVVAGAALGLSLACSGKTLPYAGGLMIAVQTDLAAPKDVAAVGLYITSDGRPIFGDTREVAPTGEVKFPATIAVVADAARPRAVVKIRAVAFKTNGDVRVLRDIVTTIPKGRTGLLRAPLLWINEGSGSGNRGQLLQSASLRPLDGTSDGFSRLQSACPDGQTFLEGACGDAAVDGDALPDYVEAEVFGGGNAQGEGGRCFDVLACFAAPIQVALDEETCTGKLDGADPNDPNLSLAIVLPRSADAGECAGDTCFVPLDKGAGWTVSGARIQLPKALCTRIAEGKAKGVAASGACPTKDPTSPSCGPASSVGSTGGAAHPGDGGADVPPVALDDFETPGAFGSEPFLTDVAVDQKSIYLVRSSASPPPAAALQLDKALVTSGTKVVPPSFLVQFPGASGADDGPQPATLVLDSVRPASWLVVRGQRGSVTSCPVGVDAGGGCATQTIDVLASRKAVAVGAGVVFAAGELGGGLPGLWRMPAEGGSPQPVPNVDAAKVSALLFEGGYLYIGTMGGLIQRCQLPCAVAGDFSSVRAPSGAAAVAVAALALTPLGTIPPKLFFVLAGDAGTTGGAGVFEIGVDGGGERQLADGSEVAAVNDGGTVPPVALAADSEYVYWGGVFQDPRIGTRAPGLLRRSHVAQAPAQSFLEPGQQGPTPVTGVAVDGTHVYWTYARQDSALLLARKKRQF